MCDTVQQAARGNSCSEHQSSHHGPESCAIKTLILIHSPGLGIQQGLYPFSHTHPAALPESPHISKTLLIQPSAEGCHLNHRHAAIAAVCLWVMNASRHNSHPDTLMRPPALLLSHQTAQTPLPPQPAPEPSDLSGASSPSTTQQCCCCQCQWAQSCLCCCCLRCQPALHTLQQLLLQGGQNHPQSTRQGPVHASVCYPVCCVLPGSDEVSGLGAAAA